MPVKTAKSVTPEVVAQAIDIRSNGGTWSDVIEATGFNGATLRPHMAKAGFKSAQAQVSVKLTPASIAQARKAGMPWYAIALALKQPEAKVRNLAAEADPSVLKRVYVKADKPKTKATKAAPKATAKTA